jgi:hypothetical protein
MNDQQRAIYDAGYADFPYVDFSTSLAQVGAEYRSLGDLPLLVMTASRGLLGEDCTEGLPCERMQQIWLDVQRDYAAQSSNSRQIVVDSGHYIQDAQPEVVVDEIFDLIARAQAS